METWKSRPKKRDWKGWIVVIAVAFLLGTMCVLSFEAESHGAGGKPPTLDKTEKPWPPRPPASYYCPKSHPNPPAFCLRYRR